MNQSGCRSEGDFAPIQALVLIKRTPLAIYAALFGADYTFSAYVN
jgi:hypothetical protein